MDEGFLVIRVAAGCSLHSCGTHGILNKFWSNPGTGFSDVSPLLKVEAAT